MNSLEPNWLTQGTIDFEYKKYILLAYLQQVSKTFDEQKLYPALSDVVMHYHNLVTIKKNKTFVSNQFPAQVTKMDLEHFKLEFEKMIFDEEFMHEVEEIINFAMPRLHKKLEEGKEIYKEVEDALKIFPVGVVSLNKEIGYMMLSKTQSKDTRVYSYEITLFEGATEKYRGIKTKYVGLYQRTFSRTFEEIKLQLLREFQTATHPSAYVIESQSEFPLNETWLPVAKRSLVRYLFMSAA